MNHPRNTLRLAVLLMVCAVFLLLVGCSKQETTAQKTEPATQPAATQPAAPPAGQPQAAPGATGTQPGTQKPEGKKPSALAGKQAPEQKAPGGGAAPQTAAKQAAPEPITIPAETPIEVRLQEAVSSASSADGQKFTAVLATPIVVDGQTIAAKNANVWGTVVKATPSGRWQTPAELELRLNAVEIRGKRVEVTTGVLGRKAASHNKRNAEMIGGGAALGAIIGGIAGGGKGAAIGAASGAGAGTAGAAVTGKKDIVYPVETRLSFRLSKAVVVE